MSEIHLATPDGQTMKYDETEVRERLAEGSLGRETLCWKEGMAEWRPLGVVFDETIPPLPTIAPPGSPWREVKRTYRFVKDPTGFTRMAQGMLIIFFLVNLASLFSHGAELWMLSGREIGLEQATANDERQLMIAYGMSGTFVVTGIFFLIWLYRTSRNCHGLRSRPLRFTPGWAVGWYFVPVMNLFRPYQVMQEIWAVSKKPKSRSNPRNAPLLKWWWAFWLMGNVLSQISLRLAMGAETLDDLKISASVATLDAFVNMPLTVLAFAVVTRITRMQKELVAGEA